MCGVAGATGGGAAVIQKPGQMPVQGEVDGASGAGPMPPAKDPSQVDGAKGGGAVAGVDALKPILEQLSQALVALTQLVSSGQVGGVTGGGGHDHSSCGGGNPGQKSDPTQFKPPVVPSLPPTGVGGETGPGKKDDSKVDGANGGGKKPHTKPAHNKPGQKPGQVGGESGPGKKDDSNVGGETGGPAMPPFIPGQFPGQFTPTDVLGTKGPGQKGTEVGGVYQGPWQFVSQWNAEQTA